MKNQENYRPSYIEFDVASTVENIPHSLGKFESLAKAQDFIGTNLTGINQKVTTNRLIDLYEKTMLRKEYNELLESKMPFLEKELMQAQNAFTEAKKMLEEARESVSATINEAKALAFEVRRGVCEITLDDIATWRLALDGIYYFYTFIDNELRLCKTSIIPESEKMELYNSTLKNEAFFNSLQDE